MPIHEFECADGTIVEEIFLHGEVVPESIMVGDKPAYRIVSAATFKFQGAFSGATHGKDIAHADDGSQMEPGRRDDIRRNKQARKDKETAARHEHIGSALKDYDV
jgi:hypothetical protein